MLKHLTNNTAQKTTHNIASKLRQSYQEKTGITMITTKTIITRITPTTTLITTMKTKITITTHTQKRRCTCK